MKCHLPGVTAQDFLTWLGDNDKQALKAKLETNAEALQSIRALLNQNQEAFSAKLKEIDTLLATIANRMEDFSALVQAVRPRVELSEQAISILRQLDQSGASQFLFFDESDPPELIPMDGATGNIKCKEERFIRDDLDTLVEHEFLRQDYNSRGDSIFILTRAGSKLVNLVDGGAS